MKTFSRSKWILSALPGLMAPGLVAGLVTGLVTVRPAHAGWKECKEFLTGERSSPFLTAREKFYRDQRRKNPRWLPEAKRYGQAKYSSSDESAPVRDNLLLDIGYWWFPGNVWHDVIAPDNRAALHAATESGGAPSSAGSSFVGSNDAGSTYATRADESRSERYSRFDDPPGPPRASASPWSDTAARSDDTPRAYDPPTETPRHSYAPTETPQYSHTPSDTPSQTSSHNSYTHTHSTHSHTPASDPAPSGGGYGGGSDGGASGSSDSSSSSSAGSD